MLAGDSVLALVLARGGSKGLPRKNVLPAGGKPLIAWTIGAARGSTVADRVVLSTDDAEIAATASAYGCEVPFLRPAALATDEANSIDVVMHALDALADRYAWIVLLQPTSPLRTAADIDAALHLCQDKAADFCVSVTELEEPLGWVFGLGGDGQLLSLELENNITRRQEARPLVRLNGAVYVARVNALRATRSFITPSTLSYVMPRDRSIDIDDETDLTIADALLRRHSC